MEERSLRVYAEKTFFSRLTNTITKLLIPTKIGINGMLISMKRNNVIKAYENYIEAEKEENTNKKEELEKKYEDVYTLYLEAIDKHIMDNVYKKVKNDTATEFEKSALSKYYMIVHLKETEYLEYKYKKQKFLLELDYETIQQLKKEKLLQNYKSFYCARIESLYKGLLKNYSIKLADHLSQVDKDIVYDNIFETLEQYISNVLPLKMEEEPDNKTYQEIMEEYEKFDEFTVGKLDQNDVLEKEMILLGISRKLFTHSLPLIVAEQCYIKLLKNIRSLIVDTRVARKKEKAYELLIDIIDDYNIKLLSTKIYWDKPADREEYKNFWKKYQEIEKLKETDFIQYMKQKEILFISSDLKKVYRNENKYCKIIKFYKEKLVSLGAMRKLPNHCISKNHYIKIKEKSKKEKIVG